MYSCFKVLGFSVSADSPKGMDHPKESRTVAVKVFRNTLAVLNGNIATSRKDGQRPRCLSGAGNGGKVDSEKEPHNTRFP